MKKIIILLSLSFPFVARSQSVGIGISTPNPSAILHLESTSKGFLLPNMATSQRLAIIAPAEGLMVYDFNTKSIWMNTPSGWTEMVTEGTNLWLKNSTDIYRPTGNVGIGLSTPVNRLQVHNSLGSTNFLRITNSASSILPSDGLVLGAVGSNASLMNLENGTLAIGTNNDTVVNITNTGRVGIGTTTPIARLHILDSSVIFSANTVNTDPVGFTVPISGAGTRMMWLPEKSAFRGGTVNGSQWDAVNIGLWSFASGSNTKANGNASTAIGQSTTASGAVSVAMGFSTTASGLNAIAIGTFTNAGGTTSTAMGYNTSAGGNYSTAMGYNTSASGDKSTSTGENTIASGSHSTAIGIGTKATEFSATAMGNSTTASGNASTAMGSGTTASFPYSTAMGLNTTANGNSSTAMGFETISKAYGSLAIGRYNDSVTTSNPAVWVNTDPVFYIGNGVSNAGRSNAMVVYKNGNTDLNGKINVNYLSDINNAHLNLVENNGAEFTHLAFFNKNGVNNLTDKWLMRAYPLGTNASRRINFYTNGGANGGDILTIFGNGNATLAGVLTQLSDARLKKNIQPLLNVLPRLNTINAYHYQWLEEGRDSTWQLGVLAQEVQLVFPELVIKDEKGNLSVNYSGLIPVLLASVKEQQAQIEQLKKQNEEIIRMLKQK